MLSASLIGLAILPLNHQIKTFPEDYIYFNGISGGNKKAWSNFEYDYYFHGMKKASDHVKELVKNEDVVVASNCNLSNYFSDSENISYNYCRFIERSSTDWDYAVFGINYIHPQLLKNGKWFSTQTEKIFFHKNNPITVLLKRKDKTDYYGHQFLKNNNFENAKEMFVASVLKDPNNAWNIAQIVKIAIKQSDIESFNRYLQKGRSVYPDYEPFYLLEAQFFYEHGKYAEAQLILDKLQSINDRYKPAKKLQEQVNKKTKKLIN
jgi:tetratricopeptide (TPR) repeat protein